ncbi:MAG: phage shock protein B [Pseudohongiellaceae bacterium]|jgi:phage shock protein B
MVFFEFLTATVAMTLGAITIWIFILRKDKRDARSYSPSDKSLNISELSSMAESLNQRIDVLESILDAEVPEWREQNEQRNE